MCAAFAEDQGSVKSEDSLTCRAKFLCSYGGRIMPRPHDSQLRYVGGETRILSVHRNISLADLLARLRKICPYDNPIVKYQLPNEDLDALVSIITDEDLENMMEEFDRIESKDSSSRLRLFLFPAAPKQPPNHENAANPEHKFLEALNGVYRKANVVPVPVPDPVLDEQYRRQPVVLVDKAALVAPQQSPAAIGALPTMQIGGAAAMQHQPVHPQLLKVPAAAAAVQTVIPPPVQALVPPTPVAASPIPAPTSRVAVPQTLLFPASAIPAQALVPPAPVAASPSPAVAAVAPAAAAASPLIPSVVPPAVSPQILQPSPVSLVAAAAPAVVPSKILPAAAAACRVLAPAIVPGAQSAAPVVVAARSMVPQAMASSRALPASTYVPLIEASRGLLPKGMVIRQYSVEDDHSDVSSQASNSQLTDSTFANLDRRDSGDNNVNVDDRHIRVLDDIERMKLADKVPDKIRIPQRNEVFDLHGSPRHVLVPEQQAVEALNRPQAFGHQVYVPLSDGIHRKVTPVPAPVEVSAIAGATMTAPHHHRQYSDRSDQENGALGVNGLAVPEVDRFPVLHPVNFFKQQQVPAEAGAAIHLEAPHIGSKPLVNVFPQIVAANPFKAP